MELGDGGGRKVKERRGMTDMGEKKVENGDRAKRGEALSRSCCLCSYEPVTYSLLVATRSLILWHIYTLLSACVPGGHTLRYLEAGT